MQKKFLSNLVFVILLNLIVKPISIFGIDATVQNQVGAESYGMYFSLLNLSFLFTIFLDLGINNYTTRHIAQFPHIVTRYMGKLLTFRLFLFLIYAVLTLFVAVWLGFELDQIGILALLLFNQLLVVFIGYFRSHFSGLLLFKTDAFISILDRLFLIIVGGYILFFSDYQIKIEWFVWMQTFAYGCTFLIAMFSLFKKIGLPKISFQWAFSIAIVKKSLPFAILFLLMTIYTRSDAILLERLHHEGEYQAGIYAQGFRLLDALYMFGILFANLLLPMFSAQIKRREQILPLLKMSAEILIGGSFILMLVLIFNTHEILALIYSNNVDNTIVPFQYLMISFLGMTFTLIFGTLMTANGSLKLLNQISFIGCLVSLGLNFYLIPKFGANGAALTSVITQVGLGITQLIFVFILFKFSFKIALIIKYVMFALVATVLIKFLGFNIFIQLAFGIGLLFVFKMIDVKQILLTLKSNT